MGEKDNEWKPRDLDTANYGKVTAAAAAGTSDGHPIESVNTLHRNIVS